MNRCEPEKGCHDGRRSPLGHPTGLTTGEAVGLLHLVVRHNEAKWRSREQVAVKIDVQLFEA
jgi:hypothetical protein